MAAGPTDRRRADGATPSFHKRPPGLALGDEGGEQGRVLDALHSYSSFSADRHAREAASAGDGASFAAAAAPAPIATIAASVRSSGGANLGDQPAVARTVAGGILLGGYRGDVGTRFRVDALTGDRQRRRAQAGVHLDSHLSEFSVSGAAMLAAVGAGASQGEKFSGVDASDRPGFATRASVLKVATTLAAATSPPPASMSPIRRPDSRPEGVDIPATAPKSTGFSALKLRLGGLDASVDASADADLCTTAQRMRRKLAALAQQDGDAARLASAQLREKAVYRAPTSHSSVTHGTVVTPGASHRAVPAFVVNVAHKDTLHTVKASGVPISSRESWTPSSVATAAPAQFGAADEALNLPPRRGTGMLSLGVNTPMSLEASRKHARMWCDDSDAPKGICGPDGSMVVATNPDIAILDHSELVEPESLLKCLGDSHDNASSVSLRFCVLSDAALTALPRVTPFVRELDLSGSLGFTRAAVAAAFASLPTLRVVRLAGCDHLFHADGGVAQAVSTAADATAAETMAPEAASTAGFALVGTLAQLSTTPGGVEEFKRAAMEAPTSPKKAAPVYGRRANVAADPGQPGLWLVRKRGAKTQAFEGVRAVDAWVPRVLPAAPPSGTAGDQATAQLVKRAASAGVQLQPAQSVGTDPPAAPPVAVLAMAPQSALAAAVSASAATAGGAIAAAGSAVSSDSKDSSMARFAGNGRDMLVQLVRPPRRLHELSLANCKHLTDDALFTLLGGVASLADASTQWPFLDMQEAAVEAATGVRVARAGRRSSASKSLSAEEREAEAAARQAAASEAAELQSVNEMRARMGMSSIASPSRAGGTQKSASLSGTDAGAYPGKDVDSMLASMAPRMNLEWQAAVISAHAQLAVLRSQQPWRMGVGQSTSKAVSDEDLLRQQMERMAEESSRRPGAAARKGAEEPEESDEESDDEAYLAAEDFGPVPHDFFRTRRISPKEAQPTLGMVLPPISALPAPSSDALTAASGDALLASIPRGGMLPIEVLDLAGCTLLGDAALYFIGAHCPHLTQLSLRGCSQPALSDRGLFGLTHKGLPRLVSLDLSGCSQMTSLGLRAVVYTCPLLEELCMPGCSGIDDKALYAISYAPCAASLRTIDLTRAERVTAIAVLRMLQRCAVIPCIPALRTVHRRCPCFSFRSCPNLTLCNLTLCKSISVSEVNFLAQAVPS